MIQRRLRIKAKWWAGLTIYIALEYIIRKMPLVVNGTVLYNSSQTVAYADINILERSKEREVSHGETWWTDEGSWSKNKRRESKNHGTSQKKDVYYIKRNNKRLQLGANRQFCLLSRNSHKQQQWNKRNEQVDYASQQNIPPGTANFIK